MDKEQISKIEEIIEKHLFEETNNTDYELKKMDVMIKYLIYEYLKRIDYRLDSIGDILVNNINSTLNSIRETLDPWQDTDEHLWEYLGDHLKNINENLKSINETLTDMANPGIWEK